MAAHPNPAFSHSAEEWPVEFANLEFAAARDSGPLSTGDSDPGPLLNWLFVDLNSYFASVEQQVRPELRGRPVGVVPMMADTTVCIAASYEAKAFGVRTGTIVADAKRMCPEIVLVEGRHEIYTEYHHRVVEAVESCVPVTAVCSIDEMACRLIGRERPLLNAIDLGIRVKRTIREKVGECLRSSVGIATNRYLAKVASDMEKPDGLVALPLDILPEALHQLTLSDLPGIGARTEKRLNEKGIRTMDASRLSACRPRRCSARRPACRLPSPSGQSHRASRFPAAFAGVAVALAAASAGMAALAPAPRSGPPPPGLRIRVNSP